MPFDTAFRISCRASPAGGTGVGTLPSVALPRSRRGPATGRPGCVRGHVRGGAAALALAGAVLAGCAAAPAEEPAATTTTEPGRQVPEPVAGALRAHVPAEPELAASAEAAEVLLFGDSVAVLFADDLAGRLLAPLTVDAVDCRRLDAGFQGPCGGVPSGTAAAPGLDDLVARAGELAQPEQTVAVVVIANNAALRQEDLEAAMAAMADLRRVWWVTSRVDGRGWQDPNNRLLAELADRHANAGVIDWFAASEGQDWLADNVHPDDEGQASLARLVADHVACDCTP